MVASNANVSECLGTLHFSPFKTCFLRIHWRSHRESKVMYCWQGITLVKPTDREVSSKVKTNDTLALDLKKKITDMWR